MDKTIINDALEFVRNTFNDDYSGHDYFHLNYICNPDRSDGVCPSQRESLYHAALLFDK